jgi:hypothetical protein
MFADVACLCFQYLANMLLRDRILNTQTVRRPPTQQSLTDMQYDLKIKVTERFLFLL